VIDDPWVRMLKKRRERYANMDDEEKEKKRAQAREYYHRKKLTNPPQAIHDLVQGMILSNSFVRSSLCGPNAADSDARGGPNVADFDTGGDACTGGTLACSRKSRFRLMRACYGTRYIHMSHVRFYAIMSHVRFYAVQ
jgi:hypothetical protein